MKVRVGTLGGREEKEEEEREGKQEEEGERKRKRERVEAICNIIYINI